MIHEGNGNQICCDRLGGFYHRCIIGGISVSFQVGDDLAGGFADAVEAGHDFIFMRAPKGEVVRAGQAGEAVRPGGAQVNDLSLPQFLQ